MNDGALGWRRVLAGQLSVGDHLPLQRRTVVAIDDDEVTGHLLVTTAAGDGDTARRFVHRWKRKTPVFVET